MLRRVTLIANPAALRASRAKIDLAAALFRQGGRETDVILTECRGQAETLSRELAGRADLLVVAAGGDGTINEVINGLAYSETPLAVLPLGTANVLAKELSIPEDPREAVAIALRGQTHNVSLGRILLGHTPSQRGRYFMLMAGVGFDGEAVYGCHSGIKRRAGKTAYILSGLKALGRHRPEQLTFLIDGEVCSGFGAIIGNAAKYGGHFAVTSRADIHSPELHAFVMQGSRRSDILRYVWGVLRGRHIDFPDIVYRPARSITVKGHARVQIDGDYAGTTPAVITAEPHALRLVY
jgi:YegS/Rv2252/BmrU family lipid kinase